MSSVDSALAHSQSLHCISFFMLGLAMHIGNSWGLILGAIGLVTGVSATLVGVFPMNQLEIHTAIANTFFYGGLLAALGYTLYVLFSPEPRLPKITALTGGLTMLAFVAFVWLQQVAFSKCNKLQV